MAFFSAVHPAVLAEIHELQGSQLAEIITKYFPF